MLKKDKYLVRFVLSILFLPVPQFFSYQIWKAANMGAGSINESMSIYSLPVTLMIFLVALYFLLRHFWEVYVEFTNSQ